MSPAVPIPLNSIIPSFEATLQTPRDRSFYIWTYGTWAAALGVRNEGWFYVDVHGSGQAPKEGALYAQLRCWRDALLRVKIPDVKQRSMENCYLNLHIITVPTRVTVSTVEAHVFTNQDSSLIREKWNAALELSILDNSPIQSWHVIASPPHVASFLADQNISVVNRAWVDTTNFSCRQQASKAGQATYVCACGRPMRLEAVRGHGWYQQHLDSSGPHKTFLITGVRWEDKRGQSAVPKPTPKPKASNPFQMAARKSTPPSSTMSPPPNRSEESTSTSSPSSSSTNTKAAAGSNAVC